MSHPEWRGGIDLDRDGVIGPNERIQDHNQNGLAGDPQDWELFTASNAKALKNRVAFFGWAAPLKSDNPVHEVLAIESELVRPEEVKAAYVFVREVLKKVRERLSDGTKRSNKEKLRLVYQVMEELGVRFIAQKDSLLATNIGRRQFDCDTSSFIVLAVAHEMGWPVFAVKAPEHLFVRWEGEGERFNMDYGMSYDDALYEEGIGPLRKIPKEAIDAGVYLASLSRPQLRGQFFITRGITKAKLGRYKEAREDFAAARRLDPSLRQARINEIAAHGYYVPILGPLIRYFAFRFSR